MNISAENESQGSVAESVPQNLPHSLPQSLADNLIVNGSFETFIGIRDDSPNQYTLSQDLAGWTMTWLPADGPSVYGPDTEFGVDVLWGGDTWAVSDGAYSLDMNANTAATISQTVATSAGQTYRLVFDYTYSDYTGIDSDPVRNLHFTVDGVAHVIDIPIGDPSMKTYTYEFTASTASTEISFAGDATDTWWGAILDNVRMTAIANEADTIYVTGSPAPAVYFGPGHNLLAIATDGNDTLDGGAGNDVILSGLGEDVVHGGAGNDTIGGATNNFGTVLINGGQVIDSDGIDGDSFVLTGGDTLYGDDGDDDISAGYASIVDGGSGNDRVHLDLSFMWEHWTAHSILTWFNDLAVDVDLSQADAGTVVLAIGGLGDPTVTLTDVEAFDIEFGDGNDRAIGGGLADYLDGRNGDDELHGSGGNDTLTGGFVAVGHDSLYGDAGDDYLYGGSPGWSADDFYADDLHGGTGDDVLDGAIGDFFDGGADSDTVLVHLTETSHGYTIDLDALTGGAAYSLDDATNLDVLSADAHGATRFDGIEHVALMALGSGNDSVTASASVIEQIDDIETPFQLGLYLGAGDDTLTVDGQIDATRFYFIQGEGGNDLLVLDGDYAKSFTVGWGNFTGFETLQVTAGHDYNLFAGFLSNFTLLDGSKLSAGDHLTLEMWDDAAEGMTVLGGAGSDAVIIHDRNHHPAHIALGDGMDKLVLAGDFSAGFDLGVIDLASVETVELATDPVWHNNYSLTVSNAVVASVGALTIDGRALAANEAMTVSAASVTSGGVILLGGAGGDSLTGGTGKDRLDGGAGNDTLGGGAGDDTYTVNTAGDVIAEAANAGNDAVYASFSYTLGADVENLELLDGAGNIDGTGNALGNWIVGNAGDNILSGGAGNDVLIGNGDYAGATYVTYGAGADNLLGGDGDDALFGGGSAGHLATLSGGNGADGIASGAYGYLDGGAGTDLLNLDLAGYGDDVGHGVTLDVSAVNGGAVVNLASGGTIRNFELFDITGTAYADSLIDSNSDGNLRGADGNDRLEGRGGNDRLDGGAGIDTMIGGLGDDTFVVDNAADVVTESNGQGNDTILSSVTYALGATYIEALTLTGVANIDAKGNTINNALNGNTGNNRLDGGVGADTLGGGLGDDYYVIDNAGDVVIETVGQGVDTVQTVFTTTLAAALENLVLTGTANLNGTGNAGDNALTGNAGNNLLNGLGGNDRLDGGNGADSLIGGLGNDSYYVDNAGDVVTELNGQGTDVLYSSVSFTLTNSQSIEVLTLTGPQHVNASGNAFANVLNGNSGSNILNGGSGADTMSGGAGHDIYVVENAGDVVIEGLNAGTDTVQSAVTYVLGDNVENLTLAGSANINGTGNALANTIYGNAGANVLNGMGGVDKLYGRGGNDTYYVDNTAMGISELLGGVDAGGVDQVISSVSYSLKDYFENLTLAGVANINGAGNGLGNVLIGNAGSNLLTGGGGNDTIIGGLGADQFVFGAGSGVDRITDFDATQNDRINVHGLAHGVTNGAGITFAQVGADTVINLGGGNTVTVVGVLKADVQSHMVW